MAQNLSIAALVVLFLVLTGCAPAVRRRPETVPTVSLQEVEPVEPSAPVEVPVVPVDNEPQPSQDDRATAAARRLELAREELDRQYEEALERARSTGRRTRLSTEEARTLTRVFLERASRFLLLAPESEAATLLAESVRDASSLLPSRNTVELSLRLMQRAERLTAPSAVIPATR